MTINLRVLTASAALVAMAFTATAANAAPVPVSAQYTFNNTLASSTAGAPSLVAVNPLGTNAFGTDTVFGATRSIYEVRGLANPTSSQAGFTLNTTSLLTSPTNYSVEMVFDFLGGANAWRRIFDVQNRQSDNGFYVDPSNNLDVFPVSGSSSPWTNNVYHDVILTDANGIVTAYLDGTLQFTLVTSIMNLNFDPADNPNRLLGFFIDNVVAGGQGEFANANIALLTLYDGALDAATVATIAANPFPTAVPPIIGVPEPAMLALLMLGGGVAVGAARRRKSVS